MNSLKFKERQRKYLSSLLCCKPEEIDYLCDNIDSYYKKKVEVKTNKETGEVKTFSDGTPKTRTIRPSYWKLKEIQQTIKGDILSKVELPVNIQGGVKKKSNITNAKIHQGNKYILTTDLQDFFPTITFKQIFKMFLSLGYSNHIAHWLTKLTSCDFQLPQGTPTSTHIANLVFLSVDKELLAFCQLHQIAYTRYVDDLTFSSQHDFSALTNDILSIVTSAGFKISYRKTLYKGKQIVTGIHVFPNYIDVPNKIKEEAKQEKLSANKTKPYTTYMQNIRSTNTNMLKRKNKSSASTPV